MNITRFLRMLKLVRCLKEEYTREQEAGKNILTYVRGRKKRLHEESIILFSPSKNYQDVQMKENAVGKLCIAQ